MPTALLQGKMTNFGEKYDVTLISFNYLCTIICPKIFMPHHPILFFKSPSVSVNIILIVDMYMQAYRDLVGFITAINDAVKGKKISDSYPVSQVKLLYTAYILLPITCMLLIWCRLYKVYMQPLKQKPDNLMDDVIHIHLLPSRSWRFKCQMSQHLLITTNYYMYLEWEFPTCIFYVLQLQTIENLVAMLDKMSNWIDEIPPIDQPQRFGNKAFRDYFKRVKEVLITTCTSSYFWFQTADAA